MKEIPLPLIKANQAGIVLFVVIALASQQPWWIYALFLIQLAGLAFGPRASLFILLARSALTDERLKRSETQAAELSRFNQTIAVLLLGLSSVFHLAGWSCRDTSPPAWSGWPRWPPWRAIASAVRFTTSTRNGGRCARVRGRTTPDSARMNSLPRPPVPGRCV